MLRGSIVSLDRWRHGPEPAQTVGTAAGLIDAPDLQLAAIDDLVGPVLVNAGAKARRAELDGYYNYTANRVIFATLQTFCETALEQY
jgi:hypothetical protein